MNSKLPDDDKFFEELVQKVKKKQQENLGKKETKFKKIPFRLEQNKTNKTRNKPKNIYQAVAKECRRVGEDKLENRFRDLGIADFNIYSNQKQNPLKDLKELPKKIYVQTKAEQIFLDNNGKFYNKIYIYDHESQKKQKYIIYQETTNSQPYTIKRYRQYTYGIGSRINPKDHTRLCEEWRRKNNIK
jgi:hypothetical protein